jgi:hypothetical protein
MKVPSCNMRKNGRIIEQENLSKKVYTLYIFPMHEMYVPSSNIICFFLDIWSNIDGREIYTWE